MPDDLTPDLPPADLRARIEAALAPMFKLNIGWANACDARDLALAAVLPVVAEEIRREQRAAWTEGRAACDHETEGWPGRIPNPYAVPVRPARDPEAGDPDTAKIRRQWTPPDGTKSALGKHVIVLCDAVDALRADNVRLREAHASALRDREAVEAEMDARWAGRNGVILTRSDERDQARAQRDDLQRRLDKIRALCDEAVAVAPGVALRVALPDLLAILDRADSPSPAPGAGEGVEIPCTCEDTLGVACVVHALDVHGLTWTSPPAADARGRDGRHEYQSPVIGLRCRVPDPVSGTCYRYEDDPVHSPAADTGGDRGEAFECPSCGHETPPAGTHYCDTFGHPITPCTGAGACAADPHVHGCYADTGNCTEPTDHPSPPPAAPAEPLGDWQQRMGAWVDSRFPGDDLPRRALMLGEEVGEVQRCVVKAAQGVRGGAEHWLAELPGEAADVFLSLVALAARAGFDLGSAVTSRWTELEARYPAAVVAPPATGSGR